MADEVQNKRNHFRITYPVADRPVVEFNKKPYRVVDLSEMGIRFVDPDLGEWLSDGKILKGKITFADKEVVQIAGKVLRMQNDQVIVELTSGIPLARIMNEQRSLIQKHKALN